MSIRLTRKLKDGSHHHGLYKFYLCEPTITVYPIIIRLYGYIIGVPILDIVGLCIDGTYKMYSNPFTPSNIDNYEFFKSNYNPEWWWAHPEYYAYYFDYTEEYKKVVLLLLMARKKGELSFISIDILRHICKYYVWPHRFNRDFLYKN